MELIRSSIPPPASRDITVHMNHRHALAALAIAAYLASAARAQEPIVVAGNTRFTVITPNLIRIEHSPQGRFVDDRTLFAFNRQSLFKDFTLTRTGKQLVLETPALRLECTDPDAPPSASTLHAVIRTANGTTHWKPGTLNSGNLGGTLRTLDQVSGPVDLGQGILSRDGWFLLDDSASPLLTTDWVRARPADIAGNTDWYLFAYGADYRAALKSLAAISGPVPMPRKYTLGTWYSRYWPYSTAEFKQIVQEYKDHDFPLDMMVMDMDWHRDGWTGYTWNDKLKIGRAHV